MHRADAEAEIGGADSVDEGLGGVDRLAARRHLAKFDRDAHVYFGCNRAKTAENVGGAGRIGLKNVRHGINRAQFPPQREAGAIGLEIDIAAHQEEFGVDNIKAMRTQPGEHIAFQLRRNGRELELSLLPGNRHDRRIGEQAYVLVATSGCDLDQFERADVHQGQLMQAERAGHGAQMPKRSFML